MAETIRETVLRIISNATGIPSKKIPDDFPIPPEVCRWYTIEIYRETGRRLQIANFENMTAGEFSRLQIDEFDNMTVGKFITLFENAY